MMNARRVPLRVGVAPGTTTLVLGATADIPPSPPACENPSKVSLQRLLFNPPGKQQLLMPFKATPVQTSFQATTPTAQVMKVKVPYSTIENLSGGRLGYLVTPVGYNKGGPTSGQIVAVGRTRPPCVQTLRQGPPEPTYTRMLGCGVGCSNLGATPTDIQLSTQYFNTPVISQWAPFKDGTWAPLPWSPPTGKSIATDYGYMSPALAGPRATRRGALGEELPAPLLLTPPTIAPTTPTDVASAALEEMRRHQDRSYALSAISAAAVASTALINILRHLRESRRSRRSTEPMSGSRRRRSRR